VEVMVRILDAAGLQASSAPNMCPECAPDVPRNDRDPR
jgi:hypothetical protein